MDTNGNTKSLQECKDEVAKAELYDDWTDFQSTLSHDPIQIYRKLDKAAELYAQQYKEEVERLRADNDALRISAKFIPDDDVEANLRNQVYNLTLELQRLKEWKESEMKLWMPVIDHFQNPATGLKVGTSIVEHILKLSAKNKDLKEENERLKNILFNHENKL